MKSTKMGCFFTLLIGCFLVASNQALAGTDQDCDNTATQCNNAENQTYAQDSQNFYNQYVNRNNNAYISYTNGTAADQANYQNNLSICDNYWTNGENATIATYDAQINAQQNELSNTNLDCASIAGIYANIGDLQGMEANALGNEYAGDAQCYTGAGNILNDYSGGLNQLWDIYIRTLGQSQATLDEQNTWESYNDSWEHYVCGVNDANCYLSVDCSENPPNCCADGCAQTYNNAIEMAVDNFTSVEEGYASYVYNTEIAGVTLGYNNSEATRAYNYKCDVLNMQYNYGSSVAYDLEQMNFNGDAVEATYAEAICNCGGTNCTASAEATQATNDAAVLSTYNSQISGLYNTLTNGVAGAYNTETNTYQSDQNTYNTIMNIENSAWNYDYTNAEAAYNTACNNASKAETACLKGCNQGGG